jgi:hypothetical protein
LEREVEALRTSCNPTEKTLVPPPAEGEETVAVVSRGEDREGEYKGAAVEEDNKERVCAVWTRDLAAVVSKKSDRTASVDGLRAPLLSW